MPHRDLVVVGASAGGVDALIRVVSQLPSDLAAGVLVVLHIPPDSPSNLPKILTRSGPLPARHASDGEAIEAGTILIAPPDRHLVVQDGHVRLSRGPQENLHRPAIDVLFRSAATNRDGRTVGVVLSGALDDGASGLRTIAAAGGLTVVQDPNDAMVPSMPASAMEAVHVDHVLSAEDIGRRLPELLKAPRNGRSLGRGAREALEEELGMNGHGPMTEPPRPSGDPSPYGCPDCGGVLFEADEKGGLRFRCRIGHAYTARALLAAEANGMEEALWAALRALEEQESLSRRTLKLRWAHGSAASRRRLEDRADELRKRGDTLREFLLTPVGYDAADDDPGPFATGAATGTPSAAAAGNGRERQAR